LLKEDVQIKYELSKHKIDTFEENLQRQ